MSRRCRFRTIVWKEASTSRGTSISTGPISVSTVLDRTPLREWAIAADRIVLVVAEMIAHLRIKRGLQYPLGQLSEQPVWPTSSMPFSRA